MHDWVVPIVCKWEMLNMKGRPHGHAPQHSSQAIHHLAIIFSYFFLQYNCSKLPQTALYK
jgi:hypothetical protein